MARSPTARGEAVALTAPPGGSFQVSWRRNLFFIWLGVFVGLMGANFVFPFIPFFIRDLGITDRAARDAYVGITASAAGLSLTLTAPLWGALADRVGRKPMFVRALVGAGLLIGLMGVVQAVWQLVLLRFLMGAFAGTMGAAAALVAATTPRERTGSALGTLQTAAFTANMLGPFIGGIVAASLGIRQSFVFCAVLYLLAATLAYVFVREPKGAPLAEPGGRGHGKGGGSLAGNLKTVVSERQIVFMLAMLFCLWLSTTYVRPVMPISIEEFASQAGRAGDHVRLSLPWLHASIEEEAATGYVFGAIGLTSTIAAVAVAHLGARLGYRNVVTGAAALTGILYLPLYFADNFTTFLLFFAAVGLFQGAMVPGTNALIAALAPEGKQGSAFGLAASMQSLALLIGPLGGGFTSGLAGIHAVYLVIGLILLGAAAFGRLVIREPELFRAPVAAEA
jgi:DHA1 family multidrug resistance protein-like MFS transporter